MADKNPLENFDILKGLGKIEQLSGQDAMFVYAESHRTPMHIGALNIYDPSTAPGGKVRYKDILNFVESRLHKTKTFTQKLQKVPLNADHPYWVNDPDFDSEFHIRHIALPAPGDWRQLCILTARLHSRPLDMSKPLWEFWVIEGLDNIPNIPKGSYAVVSKIHHAAIDGASGVEIAQATHTLTPEVTIPTAPVDMRRSRRPSTVELLARAQINAITKPFHSVRVAAQIAPGALKYISGIRRGDFTFGKKVPRTRFNSSVSGARVVGAHSFDLDAIKSIRKKVPGATINDVMLTICGGALRKYLEGKEGLPAESLVAMAPVSVRSKSEKAAMGNNVSALSVAIGTQIEDPVARLHYVHETTSESKAVSNAIGARQLSEASKLAPAMVSGVAGRLYTRLELANRLRPMFNTVISNVPGPQVPLYMNGAKMVASFGLGPVVDGTGLFHAVTSYCGDISVTFSSCRKQMPDPEHYARCLYAAYEDLFEATHQSAAPRLRHRTHAKKGGIAPSMKSNLKEAPSSKKSTAKKSPVIKTVTKATKAKANAPKKKAAPKTLVTKKIVTKKASAKPAAPKKAAPKRTAKPAPKTVSVGTSDDLLAIKGIGPELQKVLNSAGITKFEHVAGLKPHQVDQIEAALDFKGRISREQWIEQAQQLTAKQPASSLH